MSACLRVHIVPIGFDSTRVVESLIQKKADKVYFLRFTGDENESPYYDFIMKELQQKFHAIEIDEKFIDIWNLFECIEAFRKIILSERENGNNVFVNVSTGSKITAIAGMLSCMLWDANPYYAHIKYPLQKNQKIHKSSIKRFDDLPAYAINKPKKTQLHILNILENNNNSIRKSDLINKLTDIEIIKQKENPGIELKIHAKYSQLHALLNPMEKDWNFINIEHVGKRSQITTTEKGKQALKIFGFIN